MSIVTFWGIGKEQVGKTLSLVALATNMAIEHNKKILIISASYNNDTLKNCYWNYGQTKKTAIFKQQTNTISLDNGIEGLAKIIQSNKITPDIITDYTKIVFKNRLEILLGFEQSTLLNDETIGRTYAEIVKLANEYYDMVFVDLDNEINIAGADEILKMSDIIVAMTSQRLTSIEKLKEKKSRFPAKKTMLLIGKYNKKSKYTLKNLTRYLGERKEILAIPYNTLFFEAAEEGMVADLFLKLRRINEKTDPNAFFIEQVKKISEEIISRIQENRVIK